MGAGDTKERIVYLDYLRIFSFFAIVMLHVAAQNWHNVNYSGIEWRIYNFYDSIVRWGVSVFIMISGAVFLKRTVPMKLVLSKYVLRMVLSFLFWSFVYYLCVGNSIPEQLSLLGTERWSEVVGITLGGYNHLWFIPMMVGLYILLPVAKAIVKDEEAFRVYVIFSMIFSVLVPTLVKAAEIFASGKINYVVTKLNQTLVVTSGVFSVGLGLFFILGYKLDETELDKKVRYVIYALGILGLVATIYLSKAASNKLMKCSQEFYGYMTLNVFLAAIAVFTFFKYVGFKEWKIQPVITYLSKCCFGSYLVHMLVLTYLKRWFGLDTLSFHPMYSVPIITILVGVVSLGISTILNCIPFVKKYLV